MLIDSGQPRVRIHPGGVEGMGAWSEIWAYRDVLRMLAVRDVKLRYRQTALGIIWVVLQPILAGVIFAAVFGRFAGLPSGGRPYFLFVFAGLLTWNLFSGVLQRAGNSLVGESRLITKVYFPRLLIPGAAAAAALVDYLVSLAVMLVFLAWHGIWPGWWIAVLPVVALLTILLAAGCGLWVSALNVRYRDFMYALPFLLQVLMYASPVVYGLELIPERWRGLFMLNPLVGVIEGHRQALLGGTFEWAGALVPTVVLTFLILASGTWFFRRVEQSLADNL